MSNARASRLDNSFDKRILCLFCSKEIKMRRMALTAEMIASVPSVEDDGEPSPGMTEMTDADHEQVIATTLAQRPAGDLWVFAYGSLLWKPAFEANEVRPAIIRGWHRSFCFRVTRFRGTNDRPGLMLGLDRGGQCRGMILRVPTPEIRESLKNLFRRELVMKPTVYDPRWVTAETPVGPMAALAFVVDRTHERYVGRLTLNEVA